MSVIERGALEDGRRYAVLEEISSFCPLGLRFWDAVADDQIRGGLRVRAWPLPARRPVVSASRSTTGIYAFTRLPGLRDADLPPATPLGMAASPPARRSYVVEVRDPERRFLAVAFQVELPPGSRGLHRPGLPGSPPEPSAGFYLFSSPARARPPGVAVVRGELMSTLTGRPAPWALVRVTVAGQGDRWGLADAEGRFAVHFPLPRLEPGFGRLLSSPEVPGSPPVPPVAARSWEVVLTVFWEPARLTPLPGTELPDLAQLFQQGPVAVLLDDGSPAIPGPDLPGVLPWSGELSVASAGRTQLWLVP